MNTPTSSTALPPMAGSGIARATEAARKWCRENPGWQAICDMESTDHLYMRWEDLPKSAKLARRNRYGDSAKAAYAEETHPCKVANGWVDEHGNFSDGVPFGVVGMMVFHSQNIAGLPHRVSDVGSDRGLGASSANTEKLPQAKS